MALPVALVLIAAPIRAQTVPNSALTDSVPIVTDSSKLSVAPDLAPSFTADLGAPRLGLRAGVHEPVPARSDRPLVVAPNRAGLGQARAMMIVGGAAVVLGAVIGRTPGTLFMVGGAVVGLAGLYQYLQ